MTDVSLPNTPTTGDPRTPGPLVANDEAIVAVVNGDLDTGNLAADAGVLDAQLASPNNAVYKTLLSTSASAADGVVSGTYGIGITSPLLSSGIVVTGGTVGSAPELVHLVEADFTVAAKTTYLRVRGVVNTNGTVPAITFTFGLYPVTFSGAADTLTMTFGTVVASSTVAIASPAANSSVVEESSDFGLPADGPYALGVVLSGNITANAAVNLNAILQTRNA